MLDPNKPAPSTSLIQLNVHELLSLIGEDPNRDGLVETPKRVAKAYLNEIFSGYDKEAEIDAMLTQFGVEKYDQMVICKDSEFYSMCEHHILPFYGRCHVAYIPGESLMGISKIPRLVEIFARRLQMQERLTEQIAACIEDKIKPKGVIVIMEGIHLCMRMRGVRQQNAKMITSALRGVFLNEPHAKAEFLSLINRGDNWG